MRQKKIKWLGIFGGLILNLCFHAGAQESEKLQVPDGWKIVPISSESMLGKIFPDSLVAIIKKEHERYSRYELLKLDYPGRLQAKDCRRLFKNLVSEQESSFPVEKLETFHTRYGRACQLTWEKNPNLAKNYLSFFKKGQTTYGLVYEANEALSEEKAQEVRKFIKSLR